MKENMASDPNIKVERVVDVHNWANWKWQMNMHFEQYMMSIIDRSRKCPNITNTQKVSEDDKKCWRGSRITPGRRRNHECAESTGSGFGIDVHCCQGHVEQACHCI
jgi:hypothetical protein